MAIFNSYVTNYQRLVLLEHGYGIQSNHHPVGRYIMHRLDPFLGFEYWRTTYNLSTAHDII